MDFQSLLEMAISNSDLLTTAMLLGIMALQTFYSNRHTTCNSETLDRLTKLEETDVETHARLNTIETKIDTVIELHYREENINEQNIS